MSEPQSFDDALDVYVSGAWRCPKCSFALQKATMFVQSGTIGSTREDVMNVSGETCPNDGEPMLRETWHQRSEDNYKWGVGLMEEIIALTGAEHLPGAIDKIKALVGAQPVKDSAQILSSERSTSDRPREKASSAFSDGRAAALDAAPSPTPWNLRMEDVKVGMRLRDPDDYYFQQSGVLTVTEITDRGFKYDAERGYSLGARHGFVEAKGREHFGVEGFCRYIEVAPLAPNLKKWVVVKFAFGQTTTGNPI